MAQSELAISLGSTKVAYLIDSGPDDWQLVYLSGIDKFHRVSLRFPVRPQPYGGKDVAAYFRNLLPSGDVRRAVAKQLGFTVGNDFALVGELCHETLGAFRVAPTDLLVLGGDARRELNDDELRNILAALALNPLLTRVEGYRSSLAGGQLKVAVQIEEDRMYLPLGHQRSTHIIKPAYADRRESIENESFCMLLAKSLNMPVVNTVMRHGATNYLLSERFDRRWDDGEVLMTHAEDFCQLVLLPPEHAFEREGGLSAPECVQLLRDYSVQPAVDIKNFLQWMVFNFLIGNGNASAKQLAFVHAENGPRLAPFFGLSSTHIYSNMNPNLAMAVGKEDRPDWLIPNRWREFATQARIRPKFVLQLLESFTIELVDIVPTVEAEWQQANGYAAITGSIRTMIERRARQLVVSLQAEAA
ncbi:MAG: HipA domain-containing protein [Gammaproteobacteria bacterium]